MRQANSFWLQVLFLFIYFYFICPICPLFMKKRIVLLYFGREVRSRSGVVIRSVWAIGFPHPR